MKFTATLCTLVATAVLSSAAALDPNSYTSDAIATTLESRGVKWKDPQSWQGTCTADGQCGEDDLFPIFAACGNSACTEGGKCTIALAEEKPEAKCPINHLPYEWEWPWIDHAKKTQIYQDDCLKKAGKDEEKKAECDKIQM